MHVVRAVEHRVCVLILSEKCFMRERERERDWAHCESALRRTGATAEQDEGKILKICLTWLGKLHIRVQRGTDLVSICRV